MVYIVWAYDQYYPQGPGDVQGVFSSRASAEVLVEELQNNGNNYDYVEITEETVQ